jgi:hypothetical protein
LAPGADATNVLSFGVNCDQYDLALGGNFTLTELTPPATRVHIDIRIRSPRARAQAERR